MKTIDEWLTEYSRTHRNRINRIIHKVCVPLIFWSLVALAWSLPVPDILSKPLGFNWAIIIFFPALLFYLSLGLRPAIAMLSMFVFSAAVAAGLEVLAVELHVVGGIVFGIAWLAQFYGHKVEGAKPAFFDDVFFLLIGPLWVLKKEDLVDR